MKVLGGKQGVLWEMCNGKWRVLSLKFEETRYTGSQLFLTFHRVVRQTTTIWQSLNNTYSFSDFFPL